jgi:hypothetical protein
VREIVFRRTARRAPVVGVVFCSAACSAEFDREIGGNPITFDFTKPFTRRSPVCSECGNVLSERSRPLGRCRMCRLEKSIKRKITGEARRLARQRKVRDAQRRFGLPLVDLEIVD